MLTCYDDEMYVKTQEKDIIDPPQRIRCESVTLFESTRLICAVRYISSPNAT